MEENYELAKWLAGEMKGHELEAFQNTPEYTTYNRIATYSSQLEAPSFDGEKWYSTIVSKPKTSRKVIALHQNWWFKVAAVFVVFLSLSLFYKTYYAISEYAGNGEQTSFLLPDNSKVVLNACSEISYKKWQWDTHRQLNLTGEAYFRVAKGKKFEVATNLGKVTVLGTQFDVKARNNRFDVTCYEGRVKVNYQNKEVIITKGKRVAFENGVAIEIPDHNATQPEWTSGEIAFTNENLDHILKELGRQYNITIELGKTTTDQLFTGSLPMKNLDQDLQILASTYHLQIKKVSSQKIIFEAVDAQK
jgi:ferric-dicitrate binding protein FerR (iron transport regulator)